MTPPNLAQIILIVGASLGVGFISGAFFGIGWAVVNFYRDGLLNLVPREEK